MKKILFVSDIHGSIDRYNKLAKAVIEMRPQVVMLGGDLLPGGTFYQQKINLLHNDFINGYLRPLFSQLREDLGEDYPQVLLIFGNDDPRVYESAILDAAADNLWTYIHNRAINIQGYHIYGYSYVPPSPFLQKDWERYDVSRYVDPGCIHPTEGFRSFPVNPTTVAWRTIAEDLVDLTSDEDNWQKAIFLFHAPPYNSYLDRAALDGKSFDYAPLDVHVGSIAIQRFIEDKQPLLTLHGHIHESASITGHWQQQFGATTSATAAHNGAELALVVINLEPQLVLQRFLL